MPYGEGFVILHTDETFEDFIMKMTRKISNVVATACYLGYKVKNLPTRIEIINPVKGRPGLVISEDGTAYRNDIDLTLTTTLRTEKQMNDVLLSGVKK